MKNGMLQRIIDAIIILVLVLMVFFALIWFVHAFNIFPLPAPIENLFGNDKKSEIITSNDDERVLELLLDSNKNEKHQYNLLQLTSEKASELLSSFESGSETFFWEVETVSGTGRNKKTQLHRIYKKNNKTRIDTIDNTSDTTTIFYDEYTIIRNNKTGDVRTIDGDTDFNYGNVVNIASLNYLFAENNTPVKYIGVLDNDTEKYLYVEIPKLSHNGQDVFLISLEYGIVITANSVINDENVFSQNTLKIDNKSIISDETFELQN